VGEEFERRIHGFDSHLRAMDARTEMVGSDRLTWQKGRDQRIAGPTYPPDGDAEEKILPPPPSPRLRKVKKAQRSQRGTRNRDDGILDFGFWILDGKRSGRAWSARRAVTHSSVEEKKIEPQMDVNERR
jgi:hypothetical protein